MKITAINEYGTVVFSADGSAHFDSWSVQTDCTDSHTPDADEFGLMLYAYLAAQTRERSLARLNAGLSTAVN